MSLASAARMVGLALLTAVTVLLVVLALGRAVPLPAPGSGTDRSIGRAPTATAFTVIGDEHVLREGSWFYRAVPAEDGGSIERGAVFADEGARAQSLRQYVDQVIRGDVVLVAAGAVDVDRGEPVKVVVSDVKRIVRGVRDREATPVVVLLPPSSERKVLTKKVNRALRSFAKERDLAVIDIFTDVAKKRGGWDRRYTDDGTYANAEGSQVQADVAVSRLGWLALQAQSTSSD